MEKFAVKSRRKAGPTLPEHRVNDEATQNCSRRYVNKVTETVKGKNQTSESLKRFSTLDDKKCKTDETVKHSSKKEHANFYKEPRDSSLSVKQKLIIKETLNHLMNDIREEIYIVQRIPHQLAHPANGRPRRKRRHEIRKQEAECKRFRQESVRQRKKPLRTIILLRQEKLHGNLKRIAMTTTQPRCRYTALPALYYDDLSPQFRSCYMLTKVLDIEVDLKPMNRSNGEHLSDYYRKINPSTLPTLIDGQFILSDGHTILIYLCDKYADTNLRYLWPRDYLPRLNVLNVLFYEGSILFRCYNNLLTEILLKKYPNVDMSYHQAKVKESYNYLETNLKGHSCMVGNCLTIADLSVITTVSGLNLMFPILQHQWPNLYRWFENFKNMDCYKSNDEGLQILSHLLETEGQFPLSSLLTVKSTSAMQSSLRPSVNIDKMKLNSLKFKEHAELTWSGRCSLRQKFFRKFSKDNAHIPSSEELRKCHSESKGDIFSTTSEVSTKKRVQTYLPRVRTGKFRKCVSHMDHVAESSPRLEQIYEKPADKEIQVSEVESGVEDCQPKRNLNYNCLYCNRSCDRKKSQLEWTCTDCMQERVHSDEC